MKKIQKTDFTTSAISLFYYGFIVIISIIVILAIYLQFNLCGRDQVINTLQYQLDHLSGYDANTQYNSYSQQQWRSPNHVLDHTTIKSQGFFLSQIFSTKRQCQVLFNSKLNHEIIIFYTAHKHIRPTGNRSATIQYWATLERIQINQKILKQGDMINFLKQSSRL